MPSPFGMESAPAFRDLQVSRSFTLFFESIQSILPRVFATLEFHLLVPALPPSAPLRGSRREDMNGYGFAFAALTQVTIAFQYAQYDVASGVPILVFPLVDYVFPVWCPRDEIVLWDLRVVVPRIAPSKASKGRADVLSILVLLEFNRETVRTLAAVIVKEDDLTCLDGVDPLPRLRILASFQKTEEISCIERTI